MKKEKFDYIISNEDDELLSKGESETQKDLDREVERIRKQQFNRWGAHLPLVIFKAPVMEKLILI